MENSFRKYNLVLILSTLSPQNILKPVLTHSTGGDEGERKAIMKTYTIKPFNWIESTDHNDCKTYIVNVPFGHYRVTELSVDSWKYEYCFDEYYDESYGEFSTEAEVKEWCWQNWLSRLEPALEVKE